MFEFMASRQQKHLPALGASAGSAGPKNWNFFPRNGKEGNASRKTTRLAFVPRMGQVNNLAIPPTDNTFRSQLPLNPNAKWKEELGEFNDILADNNVEISTKREIMWKLLQKLPTLDSEISLQVVTLLDKFDYLAKHSPKEEYTLDSLKNSLNKGPHLSIDQMVSIAAPFILEPSKTLSQNEHIDFYMPIMQRYISNKVYPDFEKICLVKNIGDDIKISTSNGSEVSHPSERIKKLKSILDELPEDSKWLIPAGKAL